MGAPRLRPDQKLVYLRNWDDEKERLTGGAQLLRALVKLARTTPSETVAAPPPPPVPEPMKRAAAPR